MVDRRIEGGFVSRARRAALVIVACALATPALAGIPAIAAPADVGDIVEFDIPTASSHPDIIAAGPDGNLWFTDSGRQRIGRISADGRLKEFFVPQFGTPTHITVGADGHLWFTDGGLDHIGRISVTGRVRAFSLQYNAAPCCITLGPDGNLWFSEQFANAIGRITDQP